MASRLACNVSAYLAWMVMGFHRRHPHLPDDITQDLLTRELQLPRFQVGGSCVDFLKLYGMAKNFHDTDSACTKIIMEVGGSSYPHVTLLLL